MMFLLGIPFKVIGIQRREIILSLHVGNSLVTSYTELSFPLWSVIVWVFSDDRYV